MRYLGMLKNLCRLIAYRKVGKRSSSFLKDLLIRLVQWQDRTKRRLKAVVAGEAKEPLIVHGQVLGEIRASYIGMTPDGYTVGNVHGTKFDGSLLATFRNDMSAWIDVLQTYDQVCSRLYNKYGIEVLQAQTPVDIPDNLRKLFRQGSFIKVCELYDHTHGANTIIWRKGIYGT